jgi:hypothetical protein
VIVTLLFTTQRMSRTETHRFLFRAGLGTKAEDIMTDMYVMLVDEDKPKSSR